MITPLMQFDTVLEVIVEELLFRCESDQGPQTIKVIYEYWIS